MTVVVQFSWSRLEGLGLIAAALGWGFLAQIPPTFFAVVLLYFDFETYFIAIGGTILGASVILATITCSLTEDWNDTALPSLKGVTSFSIIFTLIFLSGFFLFFFVEPIFPPELSDLEPGQRYFSAMALALTIVGIATVIIYKVKEFLQE